MNFYNTLFSSYLLVNIFPVIFSQYYGPGDESRGLRDRRKRPNNHSGGPCGRQIQNNPENPKFLGLAYINVEHTVNCGTGGHYTNTYGGGQNGGGGDGHHKPHRPHRPLGSHGSNQNHHGGQDGGQSDYAGGGGLLGNKPNRPFAGLVNGLSGGLLANNGQNDEGGGPGAVFGGLVSSVVSNVGSFIGNNNPFQSTASAPQTAVEDIPHDPASGYEQDKLPFFSNHLFQKPQQHENTNHNTGLYFGLFDGSIINAYLNSKPAHNQQNGNDIPTNRPTAQKPQYGMNNNFVATEITHRPISSAENVKPVHEDYDLVTEAYSLPRPVVVQMNAQNAYANLRPGQYMSAYNPINGMYDINRIDNINPNEIFKRINKSVNKFLDLLL